ncbi:hypothetical protein ACHAXM_006640 [Skeletonema potamos]
MMSRTGYLLLLLVAPAIAAKKGAAGPVNASSSGNVKPLHFSSAIQSYTIFDKSALLSPEYASPRRKFLPRFRTGLTAERRAREVILDEERRGVLQDDDSASSSGSWAEASAAADEKKKKAIEKRVEAAHDAAVGEYDRRVAARKSAASDKASFNSQYQFVGVVNDGKGSTNKGKVTWYARKKPTNSKWSVRLVHVNRDAVLRDLFVKGKVDIYGKYTNEGLDKAAFAAADADETQQPGMKPLIKGNYFVKERSWKNLWNFSPTRMFKSPSGSFWRERRISPGLYTDGIKVYESVYRYRDGKNGLKPVAKLSDFLASPGLGYEEKMKVVERLKGGDEPDLVVEK